MATALSSWIPSIASHEEESSDGNGTRWRLFDLLGRFRTASLVTRALTGELRARPMIVGLLDEPSEELGFLADRAAEVVAEIDADAQVTATFQDARHHVCWSGRAEIEHERYRVLRAWRPDMSAWFPEGPEDPRVVLIIVRPAWAEYWSAAVAASARRVIARATGTDPPVRGTARHGLVRFEVMPRDPTAW